jgi:hypothetical protein
MTHAITAGARLRFAEDLKGYLAEKCRRRP